MKKSQGILLSSIVALGLSNSALANEEANGAFIGVHTGATIMGLSVYVNNKKVNNIANDLNTPDFKTVYNIGLKVGYQHYFHPIVGLRGYVNYDFNTSRLLFSIQQNSTIIKSDIAYHNIALNADILVNFFNLDNLSFGMYAGFGLGYGFDVINDSATNFFKENGLKYNGFNIPVNIGFIMNLFGHHQIELGAKIQTLAAKYVQQTRQENFHIEPYVVNIGYSYIF